MRPFVRIIGACFLATVGLIGVIVGVAYLVGENGGEEMAVREESREPVVQKFEAPEPPVVEPPVVVEPPARREETLVVDVQPHETETRIGRAGKRDVAPPKKAPKKMSEKEYLAEEEASLTAIQTSTDKVLARGEEQRAKWNAQNAEVDDLLYQD